MKNYNINKEKIEQFQSISEVLKNYQAKAENIKVLNNGIEELNLFTKKLIKLQPLAEMKNGEIEELKKNLRSELIEKSSIILTILKIFAYEQKKQKLKEQLFKINLKSLKTSSDLELVNNVQFIWQTANKYGGYMTPFFDKVKPKKIASNVQTINKLEQQYGLTPSMIKNLEETYLHFINLFSTIEKELSKKMTAIKKIVKTTSKTEELLENKLDLFASLFENKFPEFSKAYASARFPAYENQVKIENMPEDLPKNENEVPEGQAHKQRSPKVKHQEI